jgi:DNA-directed RNA polymerase alpha subunit
MTEFFCPHCGGRLNVINDIEITKAPEPVTDPILLTPINTIAWHRNGVRIHNTLLNNDVKTIGDLMKIRKWQLLRTPNCGKVSIQVISKTLKEMNLDWPPP